MIQNPRILDVFLLISTNWPPAAASLDLFTARITEPQRHVIGRVAELIHKETVKWNQRPQLFRELREQDLLVPFGINDAVDGFGGLLPFQAADDTESTEIGAMIICNGRPYHADRNTFAVSRADDLRIVDVPFPLPPLLELIGNCLAVGEDLINAPPPEIGACADERAGGGIGISDHEILIKLDGR